MEENLDLFRRMRAGEFPNGARVLRAKIDMASRQHQPARSGDLPHPERAASAHRHGLAHLSELRFRARPVGRDRGRHAFALHARIRRPPAALRLVHREPAGAVAAAADGVRAAEPHPHGAVEARADGAGARTAMSPAGTIRACRRSPGFAAAACRRRRSAISSSAIGVARADSLVDVAMLDHAIREVLNRTALAAHGGAAAAEGRHRELSGGRRPRSSTRSTIRRIRRPARGR